MSYTIDELRRLQQIIMIIGPILFVISCAVWLYIIRGTMRKDKEE